MDKDIETEETTEVEEEVVETNEDKKEETKVELENYDIEDDYEYVDDNYSSSNEEETPNKNSNNNNELREKILKMFKIVFIALIVILVLGFIISIFTKKNYSYSDVEDVMKKAAVNYFKDNSSKLPKTNDEVVEITTDVLISNNYMKKLEHYIKGENCTGKVSVEKADSDYNYTPVLSCGDYTTTSLADMVRKTDNIVTEGYGVYYLNSEYVYRGKEVNNFVRFDDSNKLWRIVKIDSNNQPVLISNKRTNNVFAWDTRYNNDVKEANGIGIYHNSSVVSILDKLYNNSLNSENSYYSEEGEILTAKEKTKIVEFNSCVGPRSRKDSSKDGSTECAVTETTKMSLLPVYDFLNASIDTNCVSTINPNCQNYNYLRSLYGYWLANGNSEKTDEVYLASSYVYRKKARIESPIRVVIHLNPNVMVQKGKGTKEDPYVIR